MDGTGADPRRAPPPAGAGASPGLGGWRLTAIALLVGAAGALGGGVGAWWVLAPLVAPEHRRMASGAAPAAIAPPAIAPPSTLPPATLPSAPEPLPPATAAPGPAVVPVPSPPPLAPAETRPAVALVAEIGLAALRPARPTMVRLAENPQIFVLLFPDLEAQGAALNRLGALVEKAGLPRDRVLTDTELEAAIARSGERAATWYYGHDYAGADIARFLALAERDGIALGPAERWIAEQYRLARALGAPGREVALISAPNPDARLDPAMRATVLRHEIGHGHFFTRAEVAAHVLRAWREVFTEADREAFRRFLGREGYDTGEERLMANEAMAYLLFTPDPRFFAARHLGVSEAELDAMRRAMADGWPP